jgi:hypothetical protein
MTYFLTLAVKMMMAAATLQSGPNPRLNMTEYVVSDTAKYESFRLKVLNDSDTLVVIEQVLPSCGCVLATVQKNIVRKGEPGDIYVAVTNDKLSTEQPITIDVYTNKNHTTPLRLYISKRPKKATEQKK